MTRDQALLDFLFDRLADTNAPDRLAEVILGAYAGDDELRAVLAGEDAHLPRRTDDADARADVYLDRVSVAGFRGIGPKATLHLRPENGLTLIVGRNGSGKSSFAEAIELALTGDSQRWAERNSIFRDGWRNLHTSAPCEIDLIARVDGVAAPLRLRRTWDTDATEPGQAEASQPDADALGWRQPLDTYRPFLTANDLGRLISSRPSELFDAMAPLLAIEPVTDAETRLKNARKIYDDRAKTVRTGRLALRTALAEVDDDRARAAGKLLAATKPDLDALDQLLSDDDEANPAVAAYRRLAAIPDPTPPDEIADRLLAAGSALAHMPAAPDELTRLLQTAVEHFDRRGAGACPVCTTGSLDQAWRDAAEQRLGQVRREAGARREVEEQLRAVRRDAARLLSYGVDLPAVMGEEMATAEQRWRAVDLDADPQVLAEHLREHYPALRAAVDNVRAAAADWLRTRHDAWREHATELHNWLTAARDARQDEEPLTLLKDALTWLKVAIADLRTAQLAPFANQSQQIWEQLRQESNVELAGMRLDGTSTRRRVAFPATVDGTATSAMAVMSQGELHALGLAVFLPRATAAASPFRFLIIDDPVQSMDPSKVDGLAQVLADLAQHRQVVVFSHDDRLPEAVRRLEIDAVIWEVTRRVNSEVEIRKNLDPAERYLADARALAKTDEIPADLRSPLITSFCRSALEAAFHQRIRAVRIGRGERHSDVEMLIDSARTTTQVAALALFDDPDAGNRVYSYFNNRLGPWAADSFRACKEGAHGAAVADPERLVGNVARMVEAAR
ncbi:AAA family ATPase [Actinoplanes sp. NPDC026619]|uniref:AAA family ATPase n=1 Tax=Actinoplanes sp. NPDC026619 TaxID=3155798 RepID=UPI0033D77E9D